MARIGTVIAGLRTVMEDTGTPTRRWASWSEAPKASALAGRPQESFASPASIAAHTGSGVPNDRRSVGSAVRMRMISACRLVWVGEPKGGVPATIIASVAASDHTSDASVADIPDMVSGAA
jgi:hypothetical protein